jgi:hypothetical protein
MKTMRACLCLLVLAFLPCFAQSSTPETVRGKLTQRDGKPPAVETKDGKLITIEGDADTRGVINDKRLNGEDVAVRGHFVAHDRFLIDPIHTKAIHVHKDGHTKVITYWCELCAIRTYTPGICWCCQEDTALDLRDPDAK